MRGEPQQALTPGNKRIYRARATMIKMLGIARGNGGIVLQCNGRDHHIILTNVNTAADKPCGQGGENKRALGGET